MIGELVPFRAFHDGPDLIAVIEGAAFVQAPWPPSWPAAMGRDVPAAIAVTARAAVDAPAMRSERIPFRLAFRWASDERRNGAVLGYPFDRPLVRAALGVLIAVGVDQDDQLGVDIFGQVAAEGPHVVAVRFTAGPVRAIVIGLLPGSATAGEPMPLEVS